MITKTDCLNRLFDMKSKGIECDSQIKELLVSTAPSIELIKFINDNIELPVRTFYEKLRKSYNDGRSKLYINIVKLDKLEPKEVLCTLGSLQLQIFLFNKELRDKSFLQNARLDEISKCILHYYNTGEIVPCQRLLSLIRTDLKLLEEISK